MDKDGSKYDSLHTVWWMDYTYGKSMVRSRGVTPWMGWPRKKWLPKGITSPVHLRPRCTYLGKHDAYSTLNTSQAHLATAILPCWNRQATSCGGMKRLCKNFPVNIDVDLYTLRLFDPELEPCVCHTLHCWYSQRSPHGRSHGRYFWNSQSYPFHHFFTDRQNSTNISGNVSAIQFSIGVQGGHRC